MTVPDPVRHHAASRPDALAVVSDLGTWSWADLDARVGAAARALERLPTGDGLPLVAVQAATSPDLVVLVLAALRSRRVLALLSTRWTSATTRAALQNLLLDRVVVDESSDLEVETVALEDVVSGREGGEAPPLALEDACTVVHTSGSTGTPKAILHSVGNHVWSARGVIDALEVGVDSRWLLDLPLYHVGGLGIVMRCVVAGATMAIPSGSVAVRERIEQFRPTHASFVSTQLRRLLEAGADLSGLEAVLMGGSAMPSDLIHQARSRRVPIVVSYGLTEMTSTVTATSTLPSRSDLETSGQPLSYRNVRISGGEIEVGGRTRFVGTVVGGQVVPATEWHATGDLGALDGLGRLVVTGRADLQFVSGGENVNPEAIEAALLDLEGVLEAVVVPVSDTEFGHRPAAFIRAERDLGALEGALRETLPGFMVPVAFYKWDGASGMKPDRPALTQQAERRAAESSRRRG